MHSLCCATRWSYNGMYETIMSVSTSLYTSIQLPLVFNNTLLVHFLQLLKVCIDSQVTFALNCVTLYII